MDFDEGLIWIRRQLVRVGGQLHLGPVKTRAGARELPLLGITREALSEQDARQVLGGSSNQWTSEVLVFTTLNGRPVESRNLGRSFERIVQAAGLRPIRLDDLRHTTASLLKKLGVPARDGMVLLGHSRISVTLEIYTHVGEESRRAAVGRIDQLSGTTAAWSGYVAAGL